MERKEYAAAGQTDPPQAAVRARNIYMNILHAKRAIHENAPAVFSPLLLPSIKYEEYPVTETIIRATSGEPGAVGECTGP